MVEPAYTEATAHVESVKRAEKQNGPALAVPMSQIGATLAKLGMPGISLPTTTDKARPVPRAPSVEFTPFQRQAPKPTVIARDTEWAIKRRADGTLEPAKA